MASMLHQNIKRFFVLFLILNSMNYSLAQEIADLGKLPTRTQLPVGAYTSVIPEYPSVALQSCVSARLGMFIRFSGDGTVSDVRNAGDDVGRPATREIRKALNEASYKAAKQYFLIDAAIKQESFVFLQIFEFKAGNDCQPQALGSFNQVDNLKLGIKQGLSPGPSVSIASDPEIIRSLPRRGVVCANRSTPQYPKTALKNGYEALVIAHIEISPQGKATEVKILYNSGQSEFTSAAKQAALKYECESSIGGYIAEQEFNFILEDDMSSPFGLASFKLPSEIIQKHRNQGIAANTCPGILRVWLNAPDIVNKIELLGGTTVSDEVLASVALIEPDFSKISPVRKGKPVFVKLPCPTNSSSSVSK
jgi:TonB family protein